MDTNSVQVIENTKKELCTNVRADSFDKLASQYVNSDRLNSTPSSQSAYGYNSSHSNIQKSDLISAILTGATSSLHPRSSDSSQDKNTEDNCMFYKKTSSEGNNYLTSSVTSEYMADSCAIQEPNKHGSLQNFENGNNNSDSLESRNRDSASGQSLDDSYFYGETAFPGNREQNETNPNKDFDPSSKELLEGCLEMSASVKVVTTESDTGALQMFLVDDPDSDYGANSSGNNPEQLHAKGQEDGREMHDRSKDAVTVTGNDERKDEEIVKDECKKDAINKKGKSSNETEKCKEYDKPSRRSLRLKAGKRSTPSFSYKLKSDEEDQDLMEIENAIMAFRANQAKMTKTNKSKPTSRKSSAITKPYACDQCNVTCRTPSNLNQHKQTHLVGKPFACSQCNYSCKRKSDLKKHEETHGPKNMYQCMLCDYAGKRLKYLKKHMRTHNKEAISFSCHLCDYRSKNKVALDNHLFGHANLKPHNCVECGDGFDAEADLQKHLETHPNENPFPCGICGTAFQKKDQLRKHEGKHKQKADSSEKTEKEKEKRNDKEDDNDNTGTKSDAGEGTSAKKSHGGKKTMKMAGAFGFMKMKGGPIQCSSCNYSCSSKNLLRRHMRRHSDNKPHICSQCGASFKRMDHLKVHKFTHSDLRPHQCPHCSYGTHRKYRLTLHILTHQTIKPIKCAECSYSCRRNCELRYHMRNKHGIEMTPPKVETTVTEAGEVELKCTLCDYTCDSQKRLKYHVARHENKTPHSCPHCDYKCSSRSSLTDHLLQHAGIKPCLCSVCGMAFRNTSRLNRHRLVHSDVKPYGCDFCDFSSRSKYNLKQHMLRHTDQDRVRRRNRRPAKPKPAVTNTTEVIKQSYKPDIQAILGHMGTHLYSETPSAQQEPSQVTQDSQDNSRFMSSPHSGGPFPQYCGRNQMDMSHDHMKQRDRHFEQNINSCFSTGYQSPSVGMNPFQTERPPGVSVMNTAPTYGDPYQHPNPFFSHGNHMAYNPSMNMGHSNPNFCYMDKSGGGYGFSNPYFYNETVFPGNMNPSMNFYMGPSSSNTYPLNQSPNLPINPNPAHTTVPQANPMPRPAPIPGPPLPLAALASAPIPAPLLPAIKSTNQPISEPEDAHTDDQTHNEDVLAHVPTGHGGKAEKQSKSQAKKTGATLDSGSSSSTKTSGGDSPGKTTFVCSECGYICLTNTMLQRHKTTHVDLKPHKCEECGKSFKRRDHMKAHKRTHSEDKPFSCKHCTYTCSRKYRLKLHEMTHTNELVYPCSLCDATFELEEELEDHKKTHADSAPAPPLLSCDKCDFKCEAKAQLKVHNETHKTYLCEQCSYVCRSSREFKSHKRMHAEKEELVCNICSYTCDSQKRLKYHMERHENKTPHSCPQCDYKCSSRSSLTDHLLQHEGLKPFLCSICGMRFRNVSRLNRHKMTHTDIKPHACDFCPFSSRSRYNLKQHMLRHFK